MAVRVFWVADMLDLLSPSVLLMTAGPDPRVKRPGCQGRAQRARRAWPCGPAALGYKDRTHVQHRTRKERRQGKTWGTRWRDLGSLQRSGAALYPQAGAWTGPARRPRRPMSSGCFRKSAVQTWPIGRVEARGAEEFGRVSQEGGRFLRASRNGCFFLLGLLRGCLESGDSALLAPEAEKWPVLPQNTRGTSGITGLMTPPLETPHGASLQWGGCHAESPLLRHPLRSR